MPRVLRLQRHNKQISHHLSTVTGVTLRRICLRTPLECKNLTAQQGEDIDFQMNSVEAYITTTTNNTAPTITFVDDSSDEETECCKNHDEDNFSIEELENAVFSETEDEGKEGCWMVLMLYKIPIC